jgi:hypothetical protein
MINDMGQYSNDIEGIKTHVIFLDDEVKISMNFYIQ